MKPQIYAANVEDESLSAGNLFSKALEEHVRSGNAASKARGEGGGEGKSVDEENKFKKLQKDTVVLCSAKFESELIGIDDEEERNEYLEMCGLEAGDTGLNRLSKSCYDLLQLSHYYTVGPEEAR
jgi:ribosome-binding ATPase YchF (GTP1/OBG family)